MWGRKVRKYRFFFFYFNDVFEPIKQADIEKS